MAVDPISALGLLSDLFATIANTLDKIKGTPKQRFARGLFSLFSIFEQVENSATAIISTLKAMANEPSVKSRARIATEIRKLFDELAEACEHFFQWMRKHEEWRRALEIFAPHTKQALNSLFIIDKAVVRGREYEDLYDFPVALVALRVELQTVNDSEPVDFPKIERVNAIISQMEQLLSEARYAKKLIREFASANLTIEDIF